MRTAEVTARFTLDAMPGKQMAIDSDLNTGLINADQARQRREAGRARSGVLRLDGRRGALQPARFAGHHSDHGHQYRCRLPDRRLPAGRAVSAGAEDLHNPHRRRRTGRDHSVAAGFGRGRHRGHSRGLRPLPGHGYRQADVQHRAAAVDCRRLSAVAGAHSRHAEDFVHRAGRRHDVCRLEDEARSGSGARGGRQGYADQGRQAGSRRPWIPWTQC